MSFVLHWMSCMELGPRGLLCSTPLRGGYRRGADLLFWQSRLAHGKVQSWHCPVFLPYPAAPSILQRRSRPRACRSSHVAARLWWGKERLGYVGADLLSAAIPHRRHGKPFPSFWEDGKQLDKPTRALSHHTQIKYRTSLYPSTPTAIPLLSPRVVTYLSAYGRSRSEQTEESTPWHLRA